MANYKNPLANKVIRTISLTLLCVVLGIVLAFLWKSISLENAEEKEETKTIEQLQQEVIDLTNRVALLDQEKQTLSEKVELYENSSNEERLESLTERNKELEKMAGLSTVSGEGVVISLTYQNATDIENSQYMLLKLINELKASEAQAISINGERIISMSEVRAVNNYIVVNGKTFYAPFTISAIGDRQNLENDLIVSGIYQSFKNFFDTNGGQITITPTSDITISGISEEYAEQITDKLKDAE